MPKVAKATYTATCYVEAATVAELDISAHACADALAGYTHTVTALTLTSIAMVTMPYGQAQQATWRAQVTITLSPSATSPLAG